VTATRASIWQRFKRHRLAFLGLILLLGMLVICIGTLPWSAPRMRGQDLTAARQPPSLTHPLGTDELGRSLLARTLYGGAISLALGLLAATIAVILGTLYGATAGYLGGWLDNVMMRFVDVLYAMPYILLVMLFTVSLGAWLEVAWLHLSIGRGASEWSRFIVLAVAIGGVSWLTVARVVRGQVLTLRERAFVDAARVLGIPTRRILLRHLLPNLIGPITVFATLTVPQAILQESFLTFLGVGVQPPQATWGSLAADGVRLLNPIRIDWWLIVFPSGALALTLLTLNFIGDGLRDAFEVRED